MIENPFFHRGAIRDPAYFYNRKREVRRILEMLGKGQSVSVIGPRKIGKTSLLFQISRSEVLQQYGFDLARCLLVYFNCEVLGRLKLEEFYALILKEVAGPAAQMGCQIADPGRPVSFLEFESAFRKVSARKLRLALLLDEFEVLGEHQAWGAELLSGLRALATKFDVAYLTVSQRQLAAFTRQRSPFFNIFVPLKLGLFDTSESRELVEESLAKVGAVFSPEVIDHILALGGGHPYFLQVAGYWALELQATKGVPLESEDFHILDQTVRGQVDSHFEYYWRHLAPLEQYVLAALPLAQSEQMYREQLEALVCQCLIVKENGRYRCFSPLFRDFVHRQKVENVLQAGPLTLALTHRLVLLREEPLLLSEKQFDLLRYLMERQGQVVSNEELDREVMVASSEEQQEYEYFDDERLKSAIKWLRKALGDEADCIANRRGVGYTFQVQAGE